MIRTSRASAASHVPWALILIAAVATLGAACGDGGPSGGQPPNPPGSAEANVIVDASQAFQTMNGWMANLADWNYSPGLPDAIVRAAVEDLGITRIRLDTTGAIEGNGQPGKRNGVAVNDDADPSTTNPAGFTWTRWDRLMVEWVLPMKQRLEARGEPFVLQVTYNGHNPSSAFQKDPAEYAEFVSVVLNRLRGRWGIEPDFWDVANEPDNEVTKSGTELGRMVKAAGDRARAEGFHKVRFIGPSVTDARGAVSYLTAMLTVPGAASYLAEATYHRYRNGATEASLNAIRDFARAHGLRTGQTEFIGADHRMLYTDLTEADVSVWMQFTLACCGAQPPGNADAQGTFYPVYSDGSFTLSTKGWYLRQYFKYVRSGAVRVGASSTDPAIQPVAFRNPDGAVVVVANTKTRAQLAIAGLPAGTYQVTFTTQSQRAARGAPVTLGVGQTLVTSIPAAGVITVAP